MYKTITKKHGNIGVDIDVQNEIKALVMVLGLLGFANMWLAVFADSGVAMLCVLNSVRVLRGKNYE